MILKSDTGLNRAQLRSALEQALAGKTLHKILILPPDYTRLYSGAGILTAMLYDMLHDTCEIDIMPALGTHEPMTQAEWTAFFGADIPFSQMIVHNWRTDVVKLGEVPASFVQEVSDGLVRDKIDVEVNRRIVDKSYDLILSVGQVVPHEVVGMANYSKNIFVGCGGSSMINSSHMLGAFYGMERIMGKDHSPVRKVFDWAQETFLADVPLLYILTVTTSAQDETCIHGLCIGDTRDVFEQAVSLSQQLNLIHLPKPIRKAVVYLDPREFKSTWLGNKAVYRTRMAIADGGELVILAPGVRKFGEDAENDRLIRKYGYVGREAILHLVETESELRENLSVAAHLIHGSSDGRFTITYCTKALTEAEVRGAGFHYLPYDAAAAHYPPDSLQDGFVTMPDGEEIFFIRNPALGLWTVG